MLNIRKVVISLIVAAVFCIGLAGCATSGPANSTGSDGSAAGKSDPVAALRDTQELTWDGTELTAVLGTNKSTGCEWKVKFENDKIIDYSVNRKFKLSDDAALKGQSAGTSSIGFEGKSAGTAHIYLTTPVDWEGKEPGYEHDIEVVVGDGGTILNAQWVS